VALQKGGNLKNAWHHLLTNYSRSHFLPKETEIRWCNPPYFCFFVQGPNNMSCIALDCPGQHADLCAVCKHGTAFLFNRQVQCDCSATPYTGADCNRAVCQHSGSVNTTDTTAALQLLRRVLVQHSGLERNVQSLYQHHNRRRLPRAVHRLVQVQLQMHQPL
jgi:hypothetical protein